MSKFETAMDDVKEVLSAKRENDPDSVEFLDFRGPFQSIGINRPTQVNTVALRWRTHFFEQDWLAAPPVPDIVERLRRIGDDIAAFRKKMTDLGYDIDLHGISDDTNEYDTFVKDGLAIGSIAAEVERIVRDVITPHGDGIWTDNYDPSVHQAMVVTSSP
jgi:hypothetical protein